MLVDTHCHLADGQFAGDRAAVVQRARAGGVHQIIVVADSLETAAAARTVAAEHGLLSTAGVHPHHASAWHDDAPAQLDALLPEPRVVAVGEAGLDYHYAHAPRHAQRRAFEAQLAIAARHRLPIVVHTRDADDDMAAMLRAAGPEGPIVVLHSFSGGPDLLEVCVAGGGYVSFSGMVTFKRWSGADAVRACPADRLLVETDAPYLAPHPHRGHRNEPAFVAHVAERVATLRGMDVEAVAALTTANAVRCFGPRLAQERATDS